MNSEDTAIMDLLMEDKGKRYKIVVDNDSVWIEDKNGDLSNDIVHTFNGYGWQFIVDLMEYLGLDATEC